MQVVPYRRNRAALLLWSWWACGALLTQAAAAADWPQWLGPARNGVSTESIAPWTDPPAVAWRRSVGGGFNSPISADGKVFLHTAAPGEEGEEVLAIDAATGNPVWTDKYTRAAYASDLGVGPRATPTFADGKLYTVGITGVLSCYDVATGKRLWQTNPYEKLQATLPTFGACSSPVVAGDCLVMLVGGAGRGVVGCDVATGDIQWKALDEPAGTASPVARTLESGDVEVIVQTTLRLAGLDPKTGAVRWEHPLVFEPSGVAPTPLLSGNRLVCATPDTGTLMLELPTTAGGSPQQKWWKQGTKTYFSTGTLDANGRAFIVTNALLPLPRADLTCFDTERGESTWTAEGLGYFHVGVVSLADGKLLLLDDAGNLVLSEPAADGLKELCRMKACGGTFGTPAVADGRVFVRDNQELLCIPMESGTSTSTGAKSP